MKKIFLLVLFSAGLFTKMMFAQAGKDVCNCGEKAIDISTGYNNTSKALIPNGQPDNEWRIIANPTSPTPNYSTGVNPIVANPPHLLWAASTSRAKWLRPPSNIDLKVGGYQYQYILTVPAGNTAKVKISRIGGDDDVELYIDYTLVYSKTGGWAFSEKFVQQQKCIEAGDLSAGSHTINIKVKNVDQSYTGAYLEGCYELVACHCPKGWLSNTSNLDGGVTADGRCKKLVCGPIAVIAPPDGTQVGNWGFTWGKELWAYGTRENGGTVICDDNKNNDNTNIWDGTIKGLYMLDNLSSYIPASFSLEKILKSLDNENRKAIMLKDGNKQDNIILMQKLEGKGSITSNYPVSTEAAFYVINQSGKTCQGDCIVGNVADYNNIPLCMSISSATGQFQCSVCSSSNVACHEAATEKFYQLAPNFATNKDLWAIDESELLNPGSVTTNVLPYFFPIGYKLVKSNIVIENDIKYFLLLVSNNKSDFILLNKLGEIGKKIQTGSDWMLLNNVQIENKNSGFETILKQISTSVKRSKTLDYVGHVTLMCKNCGYDDGRK